MGSMIIGNSEKVMSGKLNRGHSEEIMSRIHD